MPQLPWKKWFPQDWLSDPRLARCSPATRGIWADAVSSMMLFGEGQITGSDAYLARVCRCSEADIQVAHEELLASKTGDVSIQNGYKTWTCRRIQRELSISEIRKEAVGRRWHKGDTKGNTKALQHNLKKKHTSSASASICISSLDKLQEGVRGRFEEWIVVRKAMGKAPADWTRMFNEQIVWLCGFSEAVQIEILSASIRNNWQGLFEPKASSSGTTNGSNPTRQMSSFEIEKRMAACSDKITELWKAAGNKSTPELLEVKKRKAELKAMLSQ